ncbi:hypothetical protein [Anabaena azotica]|nr:hypothetical protein [Anabaena azotica]
MGKTDMFLKPARTQILGETANQLVEGVFWFWRYFIPQHTLSGLITDN